MKKDNKHQSRRKFIQQSTMAGAGLIMANPLLMNAQKPAKIKITVGANSYSATTYDNATAEAFIKLLPLMITLNELNGNEKFYHLSGDLPSSPKRPSGINAGDLMLYEQNSLVLFYETFSTSYSYTKIGAVDSPAGLKTLLGSGNPVVTFERQE